MKSFSLHEIMNEYGQPIYNLSNNKDLKTEYERYRYSELYDENNKEYVFNNGNNSITCAVVFNHSTHKEMTGYYLMVFDVHGKLINNTFPSCLFDEDSAEMVKEIVDDLGYLK